MPHVLNFCQVSEYPKMHTVISETYCAFLPIFDLLEYFSTILNISENMRIDMGHRLFRNHLFVLHS
jgi:hypothetical protein